MKRILSIILVALLALVTVAGCDASPRDNGTEIVCTVYPVYDWLTQICGENSGITVTMLGANGADIHSYQPTAADISAVANADMTVTVGGLSDEWVSETSRKNGKHSAVNVSLIDLAGDELMLTQSESGHTHADHSHSAREYDEHVWLSPKLAAKICTALCEAVSDLDPENSATYISNCERYVSGDLAALDSEYRSAIASAQNRVLVFADRYPFRYLARDYGLDCYAAYDGCSAETNADFDTVTSLARAVDEHELSSIVIIDGSDDTLARSVMRASSRGDCGIYALDSMQSITADDLAASGGYVRIMRANLAIIMEALER